MVYSCGCTGGVLNIDPKVYTMMSAAQLEDRCLSESTSDYGRPFINSVLMNGEAQKKKLPKNSIIEEEADLEDDEMEEDEGIEVDLTYFPDYDEQY